MSRKEQIKSMKNKQDKYKKLTENKRHGQKWSAYNRAQTNEKLIFMKLLKDLCDNIVFVGFLQTKQPLFPISCFTFPFFNYTLNQFFSTTIKYLKDFWDSGK